MAADICDVDLERYLDETLPPGRREHVESALRHSADLRARLQVFRKERELIGELREASASRLSEDEERRIVERGLRALSDE